MPAVRNEPLETAAPTADIQVLDIVTDERVIESSNIFEGRPFSVGDGVLRRPSAWRHLWNPTRPSWGEPYVECDEWNARVMKLLPGLRPDVVVT